MNKPNLATELVQSAYQPPQDFGGLNTAIHRASTVTFPTVADMRARDWRRTDGYTYGLHGTPTTFTLEHRIAQIEGGQYTILVPSGLAAISLVDLALLKSGDDLLLPDNVYGPSKELGRTLLRDFGVTTRFYDPMIGAGLGAFIQPNTRLVWIEAPGSVTMEMPDVPALVHAAKSRGVLTAIDNTWSGGLFFRPFDHGIDIAMHALTKYPSGGSDVLMGSITTVDLELHHRLKLVHMRLGYGISGDDAYLVMRGLPSLSLRLQQHDQSGLAVAQWLKSRSEVQRVLHPAFDDCPGHEFWQRDFSGAGGLFSFVLDRSFGQERVDAMIDALKLFRIGYSWGGARSLAVPYLMKDARTVVPWSAGSLVRLFIGLEATDDLIADLDHAFGVLNQG